MKALVEITDDVTVDKARNLLGEKVDDVVADVFNHVKNLVIRHPGKMNSFINIWKALEVIRKANGKNYSIASVGKIAGDFGGPKAQSIRNTSGEEFRSLITMYANAVEKPEDAGSKDPHGHLLKEVKDLHTKQHIRLLVQENTSLRNQLNTLKANFAQSAPKLVTSRNEVISSDTQPLLTASKVQAIKAFLGGFEKKGYSINEFGAIIDPDGLELAPPGFIEALNDLVKP